MTKHRWSRFFELLDRNETAICLDLGCHEGTSALVYADIIGTKTILGLEYSKNYPKIANKNGIFVVVSDLNLDMPLKNDSVDIITAANILEHLVNVKECLDEMYRVLKPGGYAVITTPNLASWHNVILLFMGYQPSSGPHITHNGEYTSDLLSDMEPDEIEEGMRHIMVIAYRSFKKLLISCNFEVEYMGTFGYYPFPYPLGGLLTYLDKSHGHQLVAKIRKPIRE